MIKRIAILTSGGDAPGMNSALRALVKGALQNNIEAYLVYEAYKGLCEDNFIKASEIDLDYQNSRGGSCIYSTRYYHFEDKAFRDKAINNLKKRNIDLLVVIGGDGSYRAAQLLAHEGIKIICIPATIDNDISSSELSIGFDTAVNTIVKSIDSIRDTASSQKRIMIVEIMGNLSGNLALVAGIASGAEIISIPEKPFKIDEIVKIAENLTKNLPFYHRSIIIAVTEKIYDYKNLEEALKAKIKTWSIRTNFLGHVQRGGDPSAFERTLASELALKAIQCIKEEIFNIAIVVENGQSSYVPLNQALTKNLTKRKEKLTQKAIEFNKLNQAV